MITMDNQTERKYFIPKATRKKKKIDFNEKICNLAPRLLEKTLHLEMRLSSTDSEQIGVAGCEDNQIQNLKRETYCSSSIKVRLLFAGACLMLK